MTMDVGPHPKAAGAMQRLMAGNRRFATGERRAISPADLLAMRAENAQGQAPFASILTCADSRVAPEIVFDELLGALFVVREGGNVAVSSSALGSLEMATQEFQVPLLVILAHTGCMAVRAACATETPPGHLGEIVRAIRPRVAGATSIEAAIRANLLGACTACTETSPVLAAAVAQGTLAIVGALYDIPSGTVDFQALS